MTRHELNPIIGGYQMVTVTGTAQSLLQLAGLPRFPKATNGALIQIDHVNDLENNDLAIRYREDGTAPNSTTGIVMELGGLREFVDIEQLTNVKFISADPGNAVRMSIQFYKGN